MGVRTYCQACSTSYLVPMALNVELIPNRGGRHPGAFAGL